MSGPLPKLAAEPSPPPEDEPEIVDAFSGGPPSPTVQAEQAVAALERSLAQEGLAADLRLRLHYVCGRLLERPLHELERAERHFAQARDLDGAFLPAIAGLRRICLSRGDAALAIEALDREIALVTDRRRKALLLHQKGRLLERDPSRLQQALASLREASALEPQDLRLLDSRLSAELRAGAWEQADLALAARIRSISSDPELRAALTVQRARIAMMHLADPESALALHAHARQLEPSNPALSEELPLLHEEAGHWEDLAQLLRQEAHATTSGPRKGAILRRLSFILREHLDDRQEGNAALHAAAELLPEDAALLEEVIAVAGQSAEYERWISAMQSLAEAASFVHDQAEIWHEVGTLRESFLADEEGALACYEQALYAKADHRRAREAAHAILQRREDWERLAYSLEQQAEATEDGAESAAALASSASVWEHRLGDLERARDLHRQALERHPKYEPSLHALARLLQQLGRFQELADLYRAAADNAADSSEATPYLLRRAEIQELLLNAPGEALETYQELCRADPRNLAAMHGLQRTAERTARWSDLVLSLKLEATFCRNERRAADLLHRAGQVLELQLGDTEAALEQYHRAFKLEPTHSLSIASLEAVHGRRGNHEQLYEMYQVELQHTEDKRREAELHWLIGRLCSEHLDRRDEAISHYETAAQVGFQPARRDLERYLAEKQDWPRLLQLLELQAERLRDPADLARLHTRIGVIRESHLNDPKLALEAYERALTHLPQHWEARQGQSRLLGRTRQWERLIDAVRQDAESATEAPELFRARFREAEMLRLTLGDPGRGIACLEPVLEANQADLSTILAIETLYERANRFDRLARVLATRAQLLQDEPSRVALMHRLTEAAELGGVGDEEQIRETYRAVLEQAPEDLGALLELERLAGRQRRPELLEEVSPRLAALSEDPALQREYSLQTIESLERQDPEGAVQKYEAALEADPHDLLAVEQLARLAERLSDAVLLERTAALHCRFGSPGRAADLWVRAGAIHAAEARPEDALRALWHALGAVPDHAPALRRLTRLLKKAPDLESALVGLQELEGGPGSMKERAALWTAMAKEFQRSPKRAALLLERAVNEGCTDPAPFLELGELYQRQAEWEQAADWFGRALATQSAGPERLRAVIALALLCADQLQESDRAIELLEEVARDPAADGREQADALERLIDLRRTAGQLDEAVGAAERLVSLEQEPTRRVDALLVLGDLEELRERFVAAVAAYARALEIEGPAGAAGKRLVGLLDAHPELGESGWRDYASALERSIEEHAGKGAEVAGPAGHLAEVLTRRLDDRAGARQLLERWLAARPSDLSLRLVLARHLEDCGEHGAAQQHYREVLARDVRNPAMWRGLARSFAGEAESLALVPLVWLGQAEAAEAARVQALPKHVLREEPVLSRAWSVLTPSPPSSGQLLDSLLDALADHLPKLYPAKLGELGLDPRDRITTRSDHAARPVVDRIAKLCGLEDLHLYMAGDGARSLRIVCTIPLTFILPADFTALPEGAQVFLVTRAMACVGRRLTAIERLDRAELGELLLAPVRAAESSSELSFANEDRLGRVLRRFATPADVKRLADLGRAVAALDPSDVTTWLEKSYAAAARLAAIASNDLVGSLSVLARVDEAKRGLTEEDLIRFWVSDPAFELRSVVFSSVAVTAAGNPTGGALPVELPVAAKPSGSLVEETASALRGEGAPEVATTAPSDVARPSPLGPEPPPLEPVPPAGVRADAAMAEGARQQVPEEDALAADLADLAGMAAGLVAADDERAGGKKSPEVLDEFVELAASFGKPGPKGGESKPG